MDDGRRAHPSNPEPEPHLAWCRRVYALADGSEWVDPFDCQEDYAGPRCDDFARIETLVTEGAPRFLLPYLFQAMVDIAGEDWARHSLVWTLRLDDFTRRTAFTADAPTSRAARN